jgi:hypothetical protein
VSTDPETIRESQARQQEALLAPEQELADEYERNDHQ